MVIDFHSHILPGIDDGSASVEETIAMLHMASAQGVTHIVATPHFYPWHDSLERFLSRRTEAETVLREEMSKYDHLPELHVGAEVYYFPGICESDVLPALTIAGKNSILIEMPRSPWTKSMYRELEEIYARREIVPVIAHVDRYIRPLQTHHIPRRLAELPVLVQANAEFFLQRSTARMALRMLNEDRIHLLGSDCHNTRTRKPNLGAAVEQIKNRLGNDTLDRVNMYAQSVLFEEM